MCDSPLNRTLVSFESRTGMITVGKAAALSAPFPAAAAAAAAAAARRLSRSVWTRARMHCLRARRERAMDWDKDEDATGMLVLEYTVIQLYSCSYSPNTLSMVSIPP